MVSVTKVAIIDSQPIVTTALSVMLDQQGDMTVCGTASNSADGTYLCEKQQPDVAIMDISLSDAHGLGLIQNIVASSPLTKVIVFSNYDENVVAERALRAGAHGYVRKTETVSTLTDAIRSVRRGEYWFKDKVVAMILRSLSKRQTADGLPPTSLLTDRELEVFQLLGLGKTATEIGEILSLSRKTVETYRRRLMEKLNVDNIPALVRHAVLWSEGQHN